MALGLARQNNNLWLLTFLFLWELSIAVIFMALYMKGDRPFAEFFVNRPGMAFLGAIAVFIIAGAIIIRRYLSDKRSSLQLFRLIVTMNLVTVALMLITAEATIRIVTRSSTEGEKLGNITLKPKSWEALSLRSRQLLHEAAARRPFHVYDEVMGWTVGSNRRSADGLYYSSSEGVRAPHDGVSFARPTKKTRIALVGDSYTFGEDVAYEDSWGDLLEKSLGSEFEVLNFGVPGYGVDQAYLRYEKDVRGWKPKIVILSFIAHDIERTMTVYTALNYPHWDMPFSKPRFILRDGDLKAVNMPPLTPEAILSRETIFDLPFLEYDRGYKASDWQRNFFHLSYLSRAFTTWLPRWEPVAHHVSDEALTSVNASIVKAFARSVEEAEAMPIVVYHPKRDFNTASNYSLSRRVLQEAGVPYSEPTSCLLELAPDDWFLPQGHYSPKGNAAVAKCLVNVVQQALLHTS